MYRLLILKCFNKVDMKKKLIALSALLCAGFNLFAQTDSLHYSNETHFKNIQQLTFGGDNAEAYWSFNGKKIVFQRTSVKNGVPCDQIFVGNVPKKGEQFNYKMVSTGKGRT